MPVTEPPDGKGRTHLLLEEQVAHAETEEEDSNSADALFGPKGHRDDAVDDTHDKTYAEADQQSSHRSTRLQDGPVGTESTQKHDAVDTQVQHPAALPDGFAQTGQKEWRGQPDP